MDINFYILLIHLISCAFMTGLIWVIQILHYPAFAFIAPERFQKFHNFHSRRITFIVLPLMSIELVSGIALVVYVSNSALWLVNVVGLAAIWAVTGLISVPLHNALASVQDFQKIDKLVQSNWIRTGIWSVRLVLLTYLIIQFTKENFGYVRS